MQQTIEALIRGNSDILEFYQRASEHWGEILEETQPLDAATLGGRLIGEQIWFEQNCGGKYPGQEIMVLTGIAQFYSTGDGFGEDREKALIVLNAFDHCNSTEAKYYAKLAAEIYDLCDPA